MGVNKVIYSGETLVDMTDATVTPYSLLEGAKAYDAKGNLIEGAVVIAPIDATLSVAGAGADAKATGDAITTHTNNKSNPHGVTKSQVGLGNVPNVATNDQTPTYTTASANTALTSGEKLSVAFGKIAKAVSSLISHLANTSNPHSVTKSQVGLGNVENKSSATIRSEITSSNVTTALGYTPPKQDTVYTHPTYTAKSAGLYKVTVDGTGHISATTAVAKSDITALGIPAQDTVYTHPTSHPASMITGLATVATSGSYNDLSNKPNIPSAYTLPNATSSTLGGVKIGSNISVSSGTISLSKSNVTSALGYTPPTTNTTYNVVSTTADGLAPKRDGSTTKFLRADGTWAVPPDTNTTYSAATTSAAGLMSASDKSKLDGIATGANKITVDSALSSSSTNPVQNKVINSALAGKLSTTGTASKATADASGNNIANTYAKKTEVTTVDNKFAGCWISFTDENGNTTTEPYIHWEE